LDPRLSFLIGFFVLLIWVLLARISVACCPARFPLLLPPVRSPIRALLQFLHTSRSPHPAVSRVPIRFVASAGLRFVPSADPIFWPLRRVAHVSECRSDLCVPLSFAASVALDPPVDFSCAAVDPDSSCRQVPVRLHGCRSCYTPVSLLSALDLDVRLESLLSAFGFPVPVKKLCASLLCSLGFGFVLYCRFKAVTSPALIKCCSSKSIFLIACELLQVEASLLLSRQIKRLKVSCLICTPAVISQTRTPGVW
jgi:hypothetical protein